MYGIAVLVQLTHAKEDGIHGVDGQTIMDAHKLIQTQNNVK